MPVSRTFLVEGKLVHLGSRVTTVPGSLRPILEILRPRLGSLSLRREYIGLHGTLEGRLQRMPRNLVAPTSGNQRISRIIQLIDG